jgi:dynein heavy chain
MDQYERIAKEVEPKQLALNEAEAALNVTMAALAKKQAQLSAVESELSELQQQLVAANAKQADLAKHVELCAAKLARAETLIVGLGGETERWKATVASLDAKLRGLPGDALLAASAIVYLGPFTSSYRVRALAEWTSICIDLRIPTTCTEPQNEADADASHGPTYATTASTPSNAQATRPFNLAATLGDRVAVRQWQICGLPTDSFSTENGIIVMSSRQWPLLIDPQVTYS